MDRTRFSCPPNCRKSSPRGAAATKQEENKMKKRIFAALLCVIMLFGMLPVTALAADPTHDVTNKRTGKVYEDLVEAVTEAQSGDTIQLGEGTYTLYGVPSTDTTMNKDLTFSVRALTKPLGTSVRLFLTLQIMAQSITATTVSMAQERSRSKI